MEAPCRRFGLPGEHAGTAKHGSRAGNGGGKGARAFRKSFQPVGIAGETARIRQDGFADLAVRPSQSLEGIAQLYRCVVTSGNSSFGMIFRAAVLHAGIWFSFSGLVSTGGGCAFFTGYRLLYAKSNISQFKKTAAIRRTARTVLPRALAGRPLEAIARRYPKVLGDLRLLIRFLVHSCALLSATHEVFSITKVKISR